MTVNPNKKSSATSGLLPPSPKHSVNSDDIEMSLRLICSMSGNRSKAFWEDVTDNTPMTVVLNQRGKLTGDRGIVYISNYLFISIKNQVYTLVFLSISVTETHS